MRGGKSKLLFVGLMLMIGLRHVAAAQEVSGKAEEQEKNDAKVTTRVTLGASSGTPGTSVVVPIFFTPAENVEVGRLTLEVNYVSVNMKFSKLDSGTEMKNLDLHTDVKEGKNDKGVDTQTLTIIASIPIPPTSKKGIPEGLLGYLNMKISETGRPASITLRASLKADELGSNKPIQNIRISDTQVDVLSLGETPPSAVSCFFFSH